MIMIRVRAVQFGLVAIGLVLLFTMSSQESQAQKNCQPITLAGLLGSLETKLLSLNELVSELERCGAAFQPTSEDKQRIQSKGKYLGKKGLHELITTIGDNYRPEKPVEIQEPDKGEPEIVGSVSEVHFHLFTRGPSPNLYILMKVKIVNKGGPTMIQDFRAKFSFFGQEVSSEPAKCGEFRLVPMFVNGEGKPDTLTDLRDSNSGQLKRHFPREGWLCFVTRDFPAASLANAYMYDNENAKALVKTLDLIDGADGVHPITILSPPYNQRRSGRIEHIN